jgi:hypothetical protein
MRTMLFPQYRKPNGDANTYRELKHLSESEVRAIVDELTVAYRKTRGMSDANWDIGRTLDPYRSALERFEKASRAKAREEKKNSKLAEEQRIKELASSLRENLMPVEKALAKSIIKRKNEDLKYGIEFFKKLKNKIRIVSHFDKSNTDKGIFSYSEFYEGYGDYFDRTYDDSFGNKGVATVSKKKGIEQKIETDSKYYAKSACDAFACKIVRRTEEVIEAGRLGTTEKIVKTAYVGAVDPWAGGKVIVTTTNGKYVWNTKVILNFSKLGNPFNQWPTRLEGSNEEL